MKKIILVIGATGAQGGSVVRHLLARGEFAVRALARNPEADGAQQLRALGAEVVAGSLDDRASLRAALKDVYGCFGVTNYWEHFDKELEHGKNLINAVAGSTVEHFVFSSLPAMRELSNGELNVPHCDQKHVLEVYTKSMGIPSTFVHVAFYYDNFIPREIYATFPFPGAGDLADMFDFNRRFIPSRGHDVVKSRELYPAMQSFEQWAASRREAFNRLLA